MIYTELHWSLHPKKAEGLYHDPETGKPRSPWYDNEITSKNMSESAVARELDLSDEMSVEGIVFKEFRPSHILSREYQINPALPIIRAFDYGRVCAALFAQKDTFGRLVVFKELVLENSSTADLGRAAYAYSCNFEEHMGFKDYDDPSGQHPDVNTGVSGRDILESVSHQTISPASWKVDAMPSKDKLKTGIDLIKLKLSQRTDGAEDIRISKTGCPILIDSFMSGYRYKEDYTGRTLDIIEEIHPYEDVMDCLRYICLEEFTAHKGRERARGYQRKSYRDPVTGY